MATRKRPKKYIAPDVTEDVRSTDAIRAAFAREDPRIPPRDPEGPLTLPSLEESDAKKKFTVFVWACVDALFGRAAADRPRAFAEWSPEQRALLTEIAKLNASALVNAGDLSDRLEALGAMTVLADDPRYLCRYVGLVPPGVLERLVEARPLWLWLRLRLMGIVTPEAFGEATSKFTDAERLELAGLAVGNAYQLLRRFPRPDITPEQEATDAGSLFDALLPMLSTLGEPSVHRALAEQVAREYPESALTFLLVHVLVDRGQSIDDTVDEAFAKSLDFYPVHGRPLLSRFTPQRRALVLARMEPVAHNARGFWTYADLLEPAERFERIAVALSDFRRACVPGVARRVKELLRDVPPASRAKLLAVAAAGGPNAKLVTDALAQRS